MDQKDFASMGGKATVKKYGKPYMKELSKKAAIKRKELAKLRKGQKNANKEVYQINCPKP